MQGLINKCVSHWSCKCKCKSLNGWLHGTGEQWGRPQHKQHNPAPRIVLFHAKIRKRAKTDIFFRTCRITRRGIGHLIGSWQCVVKVWPQTSDEILNTLRHCLASYPLILTDFHVHCNKMLLSFERGFIFLVYCFIAESIAPVNVPPSSLHSPLGHPKVLILAPVRWLLFYADNKFYCDIKQIVRN